MGMFDTLMFQHRGKRCDTQIKWAGQTMSTYELGDYFGPPEPDVTVVRPFDVYINGLYDEEKGLWLVCMIYEFQWVDYVVAESEEVAQRIARELIEKWSDPRLRAERLQQILLDVSMERRAYQSFRGMVAKLLRDYRWSKDREEGAMASPFDVMRHDFDKEPWDVVLGRVLKELDERLAPPPGDGMAKDSDKEQ